MTSDFIPLHDFSKDDTSSIAFCYIPLEEKIDHNTAVPHRHNYYEIFVFIKGGGYHWIDFEKHEIQSNSLHFVSPGQVHQVQRLEGSYGHVIFFSRDFYLNKTSLFDFPFLNNYGENPILNLSTSEMESFFPVLELIQKEGNSNFQNQADIIRSYLNVILLQSARFYQQNAPSMLSNSNEHNLYKTFRNLLEQSFRTLHKVKDYADEMNVTEKNLNLSIRQHTGKTASEHIFDRIILEAKRLLIHSPKSAKEIAFFLGFDDPSHFSKFFKKNTDSSPNEFRSLN